MRTTLSNIHENLDSNLNQVPINTAVLKREIENADGGYNTMWESMTNHTTDADIAITNAINGQVKTHFFSIINFKKIEPILIERGLK